ncbi:MAG TPA: hypothetical protein DHV62_06270 [Elusimicrobia bacterium]|nr:hypothetical protein [Elusimicrobiota bacterium]
MKLVDLDPLVLYGISKIVLIDKASQEYTHSETIIIPTAFHTVLENIQISAATYMAFLSHTSYPLTWIRVYSPVDLLFENSVGEKVGIVNGVVANEIPRAIYSGPDFEKEYIIIPNVDSFRLRASVIGVQEGTYSLSAGISGGLIEPVIIERENVAIASGQQHSITIETFFHSDKLLSHVLNVPNPISVETSITFVLSKEAKVTIKIYNIDGDLLEELGPLSGFTGYNKVRWLGTDSSGKFLPNGLYIYRVLAEADNQKAVETNKLVISR